MKSADPSKSSSTVPEPRGHVPRIAVQYLEYPPVGAGPLEVRARLRDAHAHLPFDTLILGWNATPRLEEDVAEEAVHLGVALYRWQPLLSGGGDLKPSQEWRSIGLDGRPVPGYNDLEEFTFYCPNNPELLDLLEERVRSGLKCGYYQGVFLDRIRFPSGTDDPGKHLACFCRRCIRSAGDQGLDLDALRRYLLFLHSRQRSAETIVRSLLGEAIDIQLESWLDFRCESIGRCIARMAEPLRAHGYGIGLDCFAPSLARLVGQDLADLGKLTDWTKLMTYPRVFAPAGMAYEFRNLAHYLFQNGLNEDEVLTLLRNATQLSFPTDLRTLADLGMGPDTLAKEIEKCSRPELGPILAGLPLVDVPGIHAADGSLIQGEIEAARHAAGIVPSWDIWSTGNEALDLVRTLWYEGKTI